MQQGTKAASIAAEAGKREEVRFVTRLSPEVYRKFEKSLPGAVIDKNAQDAGCDASFKLGVQYVLMRLREELAVDG